MPRVFLLLKEILLERAVKYYMRILGGGANENAREGRLDLLKTLSLCY